MNAQEPLDRLEIKPPRLRFWHILLGGMGGLLLVLFAIGIWHWARVRQQADLVAKVEDAGGYVTHYHQYAQLPDGGFDFGNGQSLFPEAICREYPNLCSQVFGANGLQLSSYEEDPRLDREQTEQFFRAARQFPRLKEFAIRSDFFPGRRVADLKSFRELQLLDLRGQQITDEDVALLVQAQQLRELTLEGSQLTDGAIPSIAALSKLKRLTLSSPLITDAGMARLKLPPQLEILALKLPAVSDEGLCDLPNLPNLRELIVQMPIGDAAISHLVAGGKLERVVTTQARFGDAGLAAIAKNSSLWGYLDLSGSSITDDGLRHLGPIRQLGTIELSGTNVSDAGLAHLATSTGLMRLLLSKTKVTGVGLTHLQGLSNLTEIDLSDCPVNDEGLTCLQGFKRLSEVKLAGTLITDHGCVGIPKLAEPRLLDLSRTNLTDACVPALMPTTFGKVLLDHTALTDAGLLAIAEDEGELAALSVRGTKISAQGVLDFHDRLQARGHVCALIHDIPDEVIHKLEEARLLSDPTGLGLPPDGHQ